MRAKFINEDYKSGPPSLFIVEYSSLMDNLPDFSEWTLAESYGPGSDWWGDTEYYVEKEDPKHEDEHHWSKKEAKKDLEFFKKLIEEGKGNWGTWNIHAQEADEKTWEEADEFYNVEEEILKKGNFQKISTRAFYDEKAQTGYYIEEYGDWPEPAYKHWFFKIK